MLAVKELHEANCNKTNFMGCEKWAESMDVGKKLFKHLFVSNLSPLSKCEGSTTFIEKREKSQRFVQRLKRLH